MFWEDDSGQAHVLEAIAAAMLIVGTLIFAVQATAITPLTISTSHQHIETQQKKMADGVLETAKYTEDPDEMSTLKEAVLYWDTNEQEFHNSSPEGYLGEYPDNEFGDLIEETFEDRRIATNVYVTYSRSGGGSGTQQMVNMGNPSDNAMSATTTVVLYEDDELTAPGESETVSETPAYFAPNVDEDSNVYNVVEVRIVVWRI